MRYCGYCSTKAETEDDGTGTFLLCADCGSNLGPKDRSAAIMF